jgi:hypothetical protein
MQQLRLSLIATSLVLFVFAGFTSAKEWRGVVPTHSTRQDVIRLFSECTDATQPCEFKLGNELVRIFFSEDQRDAIQCGKDIPAGKVLLIEVRLQVPVSLKKYGGSLRNFRSFDSSTPPGQGFRGYINEREGLILSTHAGNIFEIDYIGSSNDREVCPKYYEHLESFIHINLHQCLPLLIDCPKKAIHAGEKVILSVQTDEGSLKIKWTVTAGTIVSGQGTRSIIVDTTGLEPRVFTVTATVDELCSWTCPVEILSKK